MAKKKSKKPPKSKTAKPTDAAAPAPSTPPPPSASLPDASIPSWQHVNRIQLGLLLGVHPDTVTDYVRQGMPTITAGGRGRESVYDAVACLEWWRERQGKNAKEAAQTRQYEATAKLNELKLEQQKGELLRREDLILDGQAFTKGWASKVRAIPRQLRQAGIIDSAEQEAHVAAICRQILTDISGWKTRADANRAAKDAA